MVLRKSFFIVLLSFTLLYALFQNASANELNIGASFLYNQWAPAWNNGKMVLHSPNYIDFYDSHAPRYNRISQYKYGPDVSIKFMRFWEIMSSFRYGSASTAGANFSIYPDLNKRKITFNITQYDTYANVGYYILEYLKIFAGLRFELNNFNNSYRHIGLFTKEMIYVPIKGKSLHFLPEIGVQGCIPIFDIFNLLINVSGIFMSGSEKMNFKYPLAIRSNQFTFPKYPTERYYALGFGSSIAFRLRIPKINTFFTVGGYYRFLKFMQKTSDRGLFVMNNALDQNYGFLCSLSYCFTFGERTRPDVWIPRPND